MTTPIKIREACTAFVTHQRERGQKPSTIGTICRTLELLIEEMGEEKEVGKILTVHVDKFYKSEAATMQPGKDGLKPRAKASVLQIRRIVRLALVWWKEQGWLDKIPVPSEDRRLVEKQEHRALAFTAADVNAVPVEVLGGALVPPGLDARCQRH